MEGKLPLNPRVELFRWGPIPGRYYFTSDFEGYYKVFPKKYPGESWPKAIAIFEKGEMLWINEFPELRKHGRSVFLKFMLSIKTRKKVWIGWKNDLLVLNKLEKEIKKSDLSRLSLRQFIELWRRFYWGLMNFWSNVVIPELGNYGADKMLEAELKKYIKGKTELAQAMEILTAPEELSFYKKEELDLLEAEDIKKHARKYFWIKNSYAGTEIADEDFFADRKRELPLNLKAKLREKKKETKKRKAEIIKKHRLPSNVIKISEGIVNGIEWQDARKKDVFVYLHYKDLLIEEVARRLSLSKDDLLNFRTAEILQMLKGENFKKEIKDRRKGFAIICDTQLQALNFSTAVKYRQIYTEEKIKNRVSKITGIIASKGSGFARGKVRIIFNPKRVSRFEKGDILVAPMTSPEYIFVIKKSAAVITDEGGLTSHAAIISRELGLPCLVGTKIATKVLKDGDLVEVDANKGAVKIIK